MEAKVRFAGAVEEVAGVVAEAVVEEEGGGSVWVLQAMLLAEVVEAEVSLEKGEILEIWGVGCLGGGTSGVLFRAGEEGLVETVLEAGLEDAAADKGFDLSKEGGGSSGLDVVWADRGEA